MRQLLLIRHAKSSHKFDELGDHERPLSKRGERDALTMARHLEQSLSHEMNSLEVIFSSTAIRAIDFAQTLSDFTGVALVPDLSFYTFNDDELMEIIRNLPDANFIAIVAHNPAITRTVNRLTGESIANVPTAGVANITLDIEQWSDIDNGKGELKSFDYPKMFN